MLPYGGVEWWAFEVFSQVKGSGKISSFTSWSYVYWIPAWCYELVFCIIAEDENFSGDVDKADCPPFEISDAVIDDEWFNACG